MRLPPLAFAALVLLLPLSPGGAPHAGAATAIHVLGTFNGWDTSLWVTDPGMTLEGAVWRDTVAVFPRFVAEGYQQFKLVTDRDYDVTLDYCLCPDRLDEYGPLAGPVCLTPNGLNVQMYADTPGDYAVTLDETALTYSAALVTPFTARITGAVAAPAPGPGASRPASVPAATVEVTHAGATLVLARDAVDPASGAFEVGGLAAGLYDLHVRASGYVEVVVAGVALAGGGTTDVGTVLLSSGCTSAWSGIQVVGDFNGWNTATPSMTRTGCVWTDTLDVVAGCHYMKFRTNGDWGNDYGTCTVQDPACLVPLAGTSCVVNGDNALGRLSFPSTEAYVFTLDESNGAYSIVALSTPARPTTWGRLKVRYR